MNYIPPFSLTDEMMSLVANIAELVGHLSATTEQLPAPHLRKENRIKTIQSSLAIENNSLTIEQVTAIIEGKRVLGAPNEIQEVKNAVDAYELLLELNPYKEKDLLRAHRLMMAELVHENGRYRAGGVGIFNGQQCVHIGPPAHRVPLLMADLLQWVRTTKAHPLISSCVFHYEFEFIHPFADGNGRIGRLWHTLLLTQWKPMFAWLPVESIIHDRQDEYYAAINRSNYEGESTAFIEFMLSAIQEALLEAVETSGVAESMTTDELRWYKIERFLKKNSTITNADVRQLFQVSPATANRILAKLADEGKLQKIRIGKSWGYM